jgi:hypothetical protein
MDHAYVNIMSAGILVLTALAKSATSMYGGDELEWHISGFNKFNIFYY